MLNLGKKTGSCVILAKTLVESPKICRVKHFICQLNFTCVLIPVVVLFFHILGLV